MKIKPVLGILTLAASIIIGTQVAQATDTAALNSMPSGISSLDGVFTTPTLSGSLSNSAKLIQSTNSLNSATKAIQITDAASQVGATWSTADNKIDLSKNFTASMWMYFGSSTPAGDGMAFVLQNVGTSAITSGLTTKVAPGQTLGVWGLDNDKTTSSSSTIAGRAIQKSWALEFDEYFNGSTLVGSNGSLDKSLTTESQHIASNYPGEASTYTSHGNSSLGYYYTMTHNGLLNTTLSDGSWHHLTLKWTAPSAGATVGTMAYSFNDKDATTNQATTGKTATVNVDITKLGLTAGAADQSVYWGFTGSTGTVFANNMVVFESIPGLVDATSALKVTDTTQNKVISDGGSVNGKDNLTYDYTLQYNGGKQNWQSIAARLSQNSNVTFSSGTATYANGDTETLSSSELSNTTAIAHTLADELSSTNNTVTLSLKGAAKDVTSDTAVASSTQYFNGSNFISNVATPAFTIHPTRDLTLSLSSSNATTVEPGKSINLQGMVVADSSNSSDDLANSDVTIHTTLANGNTIDDFTMNGTSSDSTTDGYFNLDLPAEKLTTGDNQVSFYATDNYGNKSNTVTATVTLAGTLSFGSVNSDISFGSNTIPISEALIAPTTNWSINVDDSRAAGSKWSVYATSSVLKSSSGRSLKGNLVYLDGSGSKQIMTNTSTMIDSGTSNTTVDIAKDWSSTHGIFLDVQSDVYADSYSGVVNWTLQDVTTN